MRPGGLVAALALAIGIAAACGAPAVKSNNVAGKLNDISALWAQIREMRREAGMPLDPRREDVNQWLGAPLVQAARVCPEDHEVPERCSDVCTLAGHICDNAESICNIADELGKNETWAQEKCASAKASCREAKKKCCTCSEAP